ncbi:hypothetical protein D0Z00_000377 [Geotrichum galactomycetum]|uniref:Uncharacterized protein n=1 Tax=Geotrichum galactomycetum TaxID=27317 RepID=A0ACB6V9X2_9ASCO|nr:hypothetical protein D0Z00_000377 [Geotrichum candidum]
MTEPAPLPTPLLDQKPDLDLRRSSRANRGKHNRFEIENQLAPTRISSSSSSSNNKRKRAHQPSLIVNADSAVDESIRCICNKVYENDEQMMVQCEKCDKWQHVRCLFGKEDDSLLPEIYFCHICDPDLYGELISSAAAALNTTSVVTSAPSSAIVDSVSDGAAPEVKEASNSSIDESSDISRTLVKEPSPSADESTPQPAKAAAATGPADVGSKYRSKFRSLAATLKDDANPLLHKKFVTGELTPTEFVNLSPEELMNPALREMAEAVRAESIRNSILKVEEGPRIRRTHKGDVYIDDEINGGTGINSNTNGEMETAWVPIGNSKPTDSKPDNEAGSSTGGASDDVGNTKKESSPTTRASSTENSATPPPVLELHHNEINQHEDLYHNNDNQSEHQVNVTIDDDDDLDAIINNPTTSSNDPITADAVSNSAAAAEENEFYVPTTAEAVIFRGQVVMPTIAQFSGQAVHLSGPQGFNPASMNAGWPALLPSTLIVEGRLDKAVAAKYLASVGQAKDIVSFLLRPDRTDKSQFDKLYSYFRLKHKYGVIAKKRASFSSSSGSVSPPGGLAVKDSYIVPLQKGDEIPEHLWLGSTAAHVRLDAALAADSRVIVGVFVLTNRVASEGMRGGTPQQQQQHQQHHHQQRHQHHTPQPPIVAAETAEKTQELLDILARINSGGAGGPLPTKSYAAAPTYSIENDDDYEP